MDAGTVTYTAPECFSEEYGVTEKSDVYSMGIVLWECVTGNKPWHDYGHLAVRQGCRRPSRWARIVLGLALQKKY